MFVNLQNPVTGQLKQAKIGFSWTTFFFGFFPALLRGDTKWALIIVIIELLTGSFTFGGGTVLTCLVFAFLYNRAYINELLSQGYKPASEGDRAALRMKGFIG